MSESYCLKSCAECGLCAGCRTGTYSARCEIAQCCREKLHTSCESCVRASSCTTRWSRDMMPRAYHNDWRDAESLRDNRDRAAVLAKWTRIIFRCMIIDLVVSFFEFIPALEAPISIVSAVLKAGIMFAYYRMKDADHRFATVAALELAVILAGCADHFSEEESVLSLMIGLIIIVCGLVKLKVEYTAFSEVLSGISQQLSEKWSGQWTIVLMCLCIFLCSAVVIFIPLLGLLGMIGVLVVLGLALFAAIRELVYLYQTANICSNYASGEF